MAAHAAAWLDTTRHLVRRFFGFHRARPLTPREQSEEAGILSSAEQALFWQLSDPDQRHSYDVMRASLAARPGDRIAAQAGLLHDIGKRHTRIGAVERSLATMAEGAHLPLPGRWSTYRQHADLGAADLEAVGADPFVVAFTRIHPGPPPSDVDAERWQAVAAADDASG